MFKVHYYYSACIGIRTGDTSILCDPWFTDGAYDGSWFQYPKLLDPLEKIGEYQFIYISHIHPDHYDKQFLRSYLQRFPRTRIIIAGFTRNYLSKKMQSDQIPHEVVSELCVGKTSFKLIPNELNPYDVDSALAVIREGFAVVNMNDNLFHPAQLDQVKDFCGGKIDLACLPYAGAGPYPQTYFMSEETRRLKAEEKKREFFKRYSAVRDYLAPERTLPFAGKYLLGGSLAGLNDSRGVSDAVEVAGFCEKALILADGGAEYYDVETGKASRLRTEPYSAEEIRLFLETIKDQKMDYEVKLANLEIQDVPWAVLLRSAFLSALRKSLVKTDFFLIIRLGDELNFVMNFNSGIEPFFKRIGSMEVDSFLPRSEMSIDFRYLFGLVTGLWHWNNAEIGSHFKIKRVPDVYNREVQAFLNFFHV